MTPRQVTLGSATVLAGLVAGFFFTYQISVTRGLAEIDDIAYVSTFQAINRTIVNVWFGFVFLGAFAAIAATLITNRRSDRTTRMLATAAAVLYLIGLAVTGARERSAQRHPRRIHRSHPNHRRPSTRRLRDRLEPLQPDPHRGVLCRLRMSGRHLAHRAKQPT